MIDYGLIGNCQVSALVSKTGSMDWLCMPRPDSDPVLGRLLDDKGGHFSIEPVSEIRSSRQHYLDNRLRHPDPKIGQISYFKQKQAEAAPLFHRTHWWGSKLGGTAIVFVIGALLYKLMLITIKLINEHQHLHLYYPAPVDNDHADGLSWLAAFCFSFLPIALPLAAGVFISLRIALDSGRRTYRYQELTERLTTAAATLETLETEASVRRTVTATEEILLDELVEWHLAERQNGAH
jgi:hypothetical protein